MWEAELEEGAEDEEGADAEVGEDADANDGFEDVGEDGDADAQKGVVYLPRIPPFMKVSRGFHRRLPHGPVWISES